MYVHSVKLINYKSIGDYLESELIVEPKVTAIIGRNESGKSNILEGMARITFHKKNNDAFGDVIANRSCSKGSTIKYVVTLVSSEDDRNIGIIEDTVIEISQSGMTISGGLLTYYQNKYAEEITPIATLLDTIGTNPFKLNQHDLPHYGIHKSDIANVDQLDIPHKFASLQFIVERYSPLPASTRNILQQSIDNAKSRLNDILKLLPIFYMRSNSKHLETVYKLEDVQKELKTGANTPDSLLKDFVRLIGISPEEFILAVQSGTDGRQTSIRSKIKRQVDKIINNEFQEFYKTEPVYLSVDFNSNAVTFAVQTSDGETLQLGERSNGLRWYIETFIDTKANNLPERNVVYLFDEPGNSLHVNAQRELIRLFHDLADKGNQVIYTTHSPYMLDTDNDGIHRIRAVTKDEHGFTHIYKTAYDNRISPDCQHDTLAPVICALGMSLQDTFGPAKDKINIVTEGTSDYIYMCTMAKLLGIDNTQYAIIPSQGASNCVNICAILHGWGCKYIAVYDYDTAGVESGAEVMRKQLFYELNKHYCFMNEVRQEDIDNKTYKTSTFMVEDVMTQSEIDRFCEATNTLRTLSKPLMAKKMSSAIEKGEYLPSDEAVENFKKLFLRIISYVC